MGESKQKNDNKKLMAVNDDIANNYNNDNNDQVTIMVNMPKQQKWQ